MKRRSAADSRVWITERDRSRIPVEYTWDLGPLFGNDAAWAAAKESLMGEIPRLGAYAGTLGSSAARLRECLELADSLGKEYERLSAYAGMKSDQDTRDEAAAAAERAMQRIGTDLAARAAFLEPEIIALGEETAASFLGRDPALGVFRHGLEDILRRKAHTGSPGEERIIADAALMGDAPRNIYGVFADADFPFPETELEDGTRVRLDKAAFMLHRASPRRETRRRVMGDFFRALGAYRRTFGTQLEAEVRKNIFYAKARRYGSCLESALHGDNIPSGVYHALIEGVREHRDAFHRYLKLRKRMLGVEELHYFDLYAPLVPASERVYPYEDAVELVTGSLAPLGEEYAAAAREMLSGRRVDVFPSEGKRSGAYANGSAYDVHPYILLNYNGRLDDVSTLAHELGHAMHSREANRCQPHPTARPSIFVAEVASTLNEALLLDHMLQAAGPGETRRALLGSLLEGMRATVFRQAQFAEFELAVHEKAERGEPLTGESLGEMYLSLARRVCGHDEGVCLVDDEAAHEWAFIPHFYYNFYVYQYATSYTASAALAEALLTGEGGARERVLELLRAGGADYPMDLLRRAGLDMASRRPLGRAVERMHRVMDELEAGPGP
ncbi:MAG: oligoendopeptidase F [Bacteroidota bacterium]